MSDNSIVRGAFTNMMSAYDSAAALLDMMGEMEGIVLEERHITLFSRVFNDMECAKARWEAAQAECEDAETA